MKTNIMFKIKQSCNCNLVITDTSNCYYDNSSEEFMKFTYEDTITLDIVTLEKTDGPRLLAVVYTTHEKGKNLNEVNLPLGNDGLININHIIIPTVSWYNKQKNKEHNTLNKYKNIYVSDGKRLYKLENKHLNEIDPINLIINDWFDETTIFKSQQFLFLTCYLTKCYVNLCNQVIKELAKNKNAKNGHYSGECSNVNNEAKDLIYNKDLVYITLNVINYLTQDCLFEEAEQILENIQNCKGICYNNNELLLNESSKMYYSNQNSVGIIYNTGCGCGK